jgi:hypothetical protein
MSVEYSFRSKTERQAFIKGVQVGTSLKLDHVDTADAGNRKFKARVYYRPTLEEILAR